MKVLYTAEATATGDARNGHVTSTDGFVNADLAVPVEMGGKGGATNPEQLFAAGYAACFHGALKLVARQEKVSVDNSTITARVGIGPNDAGSGYALAVTLTAALPGVDPATAQKLVAGAHQVCPYSNATRGNVDVQVEVAQ